MFYINQNLSSFRSARNEHYVNIRYIVKKKLLGSQFTEPRPNGCKRDILRVKEIEADVADFLNNESNLKDILIGPPEVLDGIKDRFTDQKGVNSLKFVLNYGAFISKSDKGAFHFYNSYHLAENLRQDTCVYCNRLYTNTIISKNGECIARPTFDHWFPKSQYPLLALSFYNLIPSCSICNTNVKVASAYSIKNAFHPYLKHWDSKRQLDFRFSFSFADALSAESKIVTNNEFTETSIKLMKLREIYSAHTEEIRDLIYLKKAYSESYLDSLRTILKMQISTGEIYRLAFGAYFEDELLHKRPLSKLKKDILAELGVVK